MAHGELDAANHACGVRPGLVARGDVATGDCLAVLSSANRVRTSCFFGRRAMDSYAPTVGALAIAKLRPSER